MNSLTYDILSGTPFRLIAIGVCLILLALLLQLRRIRINHHLRGCEIQRELQADNAKRVVEEDRKLSQREIHKRLKAQDRHMREERFK